MQDDTYSELELRIKSIEKKQKRSKFTNLFLLLIIISGLMYGFQITQKFKTLEVEKLVLIDSLGKQRVVMMIDEKFDPKYQMFNKNGDEVFDLSLVRDKANINMRFIDSNKNESVLLLNSTECILKNDTNCAIHLTTEYDLSPYIFIYRKDNSGSSFSSDIKASSIQMVHAKNGESNNYIYIKNFGEGDSLGIKISKHSSERDSMFAEAIEVKIENFGPQIHMYDYNKTTLKYRYRQLLTNYGNKCVCSLDSTKLVFGYDWSDSWRSRLVHTQPGMRIYDRINSLRYMSGITYDKNMVYTSYYGKSSSDITIIGNLQNNGFLDFYKNDRTRISLNFTDYGVPSISMFDYYGNIRLNLGGIKTTRNGRSINNYESSIFLFNEKGNGLFSAP